MESHGLAGLVHISLDCYESILDKSRFIIEDRGLIEVKGKGQMHTYLVTGIHRSITGAHASIRLPDRICSQQWVQAGLSGAGLRYGRSGSSAKGSNFQMKSIGEVNRVLEVENVALSPEDALAAMLDDEVREVTKKKDLVVLGGSSSNRGMDSTASNIELSAATHEN